MNLNIQENWSAEKQEQQQEQSDNIEKSPTPCCFNHFF